ncbi:LysR family transcriptional regulator [Streptomyces sp. NPDC003023]|uniref:LysR family transcriptional regulator n=1 Tax=Streptomyces sp. NPDC003023 TaxID=3364675 RepID=UPI0036AA0500
MDLDIQDLRLLRAVARAGSISGAARDLGIDQANVSRRLQRLERITGLPVVVRRRGSVTLTDAGRLLLRGADTLLPLVDRLLATGAERRSHDLPGRFRLAGASHSATPVVVSHLSRMLPAVSVVLCDETAGSPLTLLREGEADLALMSSCPGPEELAAENFALALLGREPDCGGQSPAAGRSAPADALVLLWDPQGPFAAHAARLAFLVRPAHPEAP